MSDESLIKEFEQQQVGKLKLSEAIRIGAKLRPQCFEQEFSDTGSCAIGSAYHGLTGMVTYNYMVTTGWLKRNFPDVPTNLFTEITQMNDRWKMTREAIADWLAAEGY